MNSLAPEKSESLEAHAEQVGPARGQTGSTWRTAWRLICFTAGVDRRGFWMTVLTSLAASLSEGLGLVLLLPLLAVAGMNLSGSSAASGVALEAQRLLVRAAIPRGLWLPVVLVAFLATAGVRSVLRRSQ